MGGVNALKMIKANAENWLSDSCHPFHRGGMLKHLASRPGKPMLFQNIKQKQHPCVQACSFARASLS